MKLRITHRTMLAPVLVLTAGMVSAQQNTSQELLRQYDKDSDQKLSSQEFQTLYRDHMSEGQTTQTSSRQNTQDLSQIARQQPDQLKGMAVQDRQGQKIGEIEQVVRQKSSGDIHVVITSGGFVGIGGTKAAVAVKELQREGDNILYNAQNPQEKLRQMSYNEANFEPVQAGSQQQQQQPGMASARTTQQGQQPQSQMNQQLSEIVEEQPDTLKGKQVKSGQSGSTIGEVEMVVLDKQNKNFHLVISSDQFLDMGGSDLVVPVQDLQSQGDSLILNSEKAVMAFARQDYLLVQEIN